MVMKFLDQFMSARRVATPLIAVRTPDPASTVSTITLDKFHATTPILLWDCVRGLIAANEPGKPLAAALIRSVNPDDPKAENLADPILMLLTAMKMSKESILFMSNLHRFLSDHQIVQALWNIRDAFKQNTRTLVIICPAITLPLEIGQDILILDEPLPDPEQLAGIVGETYLAASVAKPNTETVERAVDALCGLAAFPAEQVCAMSIRKDGLDFDQLWERKRQAIEQTPGLNVWRGKQSFSDIGGCENIKKFLTSVANGKNRPRAIIFQDEIEKQFAGAGGDLSGITQELLGNQLSFMQDNNSTGILEIGHAGVAKSDIAKAFGNEASIPTIQLDLGAAKGSLVGESNANMRTILKVIEAVSQGRALWIATCNDIKGLPPELRRRYSFGTFFFDLPTPSERNLIWNIYFEKFGLKDREKPLDTGWTGAEIKNCCDIAYRLEIPLKEAANYIVPLSTSASERINGLRQEANGRYISAAYPGPYKSPEGIEEEPESMIVAVGVVPAPKNRRKIDTGGSGKVN